MRRRAVIGIVVAALVAIGPPAQSAKPPVARAWAIRIQVPGQGEPVLIGAEVLARAGSRPHAHAMPLMAGGDAPIDVKATQADPDDEQELHRFDDETGSLTMSAGFGRASVTTTSSSAAAGFGSGSGSGFALADELFTFEQQEMLLNQWQDIMDTVFTPANEVVGTLSPVLGALGLDAPELRGIAPEGLIDVGSAGLVTASATTSSSEGFSSARGVTSIGEARFFGGFIEAHGIEAEAVSQSIAGVDERDARVTLGSLSVAGVRLVSDTEELSVAGNDLFSADALDPARELLGGLLAQAGITVESMVTRGSGREREAVALAITMQTSAGPLVIEVGHAFASAPSVPAPEPEPLPPVSTDAAAPPVTRVLPEPPARVLPPAPRQEPAPAPAPEGGAIFRRPGPEAARAFQTAYLLMAFGGLAGALILPMLVRRERVRRRPLIPGGYTS